MIEARLIRLVSVLAVGFLSLAGEVAAVKYVKPGATGNGTGNSWTNAFPTLSDALRGTSNGEEIWVAEGVYLPTNLAAGQTGGGRRAQSFCVEAAVSIYGGFAGDEVHRSERDWNAHPTVLSGDIGVPGTSIDNCYSVISNTGLATSFKIDGVTIQDGYADGAQGGFTGDGGGAYVGTSSVTFANCKFLRNRGRTGAGLAHTGGRLKLLNCIFVANVALGGGGVGGAVSSAARFNDFSHSTFAANSAARGGAISITGKNAITNLGNCVFGGNDSFGSLPVILVEGSKNFVGNLVQENIGGTDNLVAEPEFVDPPQFNGLTEGNVTLRGGTVGVGHGSAAGTFADDTDMDGDGDSTELLPVALDGIVRNPKRPQAGAYELINFPASLIQFSGQRIIENQPVGTQIGVFNTVDRNLSDFDYTFVAGDGDDDNASFTIDGFTLTSAEEFDFEAKSSYTIRVRATEVPGGFDDVVEGTFVIDVTNAIDQLLTITALQPFAYEPRGGVVEGSPHLGRVRVSRSGEVDGRLDAVLRVSVSGFFGSGSHFVIPEPGSTIRFEPGEVERVFEVLPLFFPSLPERLVHFTLSPRLTHYQLVDDRATVSILKGPMEAYFRANDLQLPPADGADSNFNQVPDALEYALGDASLPDGFAPPQIGFSGSHFRNLHQNYTLALSRAAIDVEVLVEKSTDLLTWVEASPIRTILGESPTHETVQFSVPPEGDGHDRLFTRVVTRRIDRPAGFTVPGPDIPMVGAPAGTLKMGSPSSEQGAMLNEMPQTNVQFTHPFWIGATEITQGQFVNVTAFNPSDRRGENLPVENLTRQDALDFCAMVHSRERLAGRIPEGYEYRLPTEAEWEYACRAGTTGARYYTGLTTDHAWFSTNSFLVPHAVAQKLPNAWGLFDTYGNVSEWCIDPYTQQHAGGIVFDPVADGDGASATVRGGNFAHDHVHQRSAFRLPSEPDTSSPAIGLRIVLGPIVASE